MRPRPVVVRLSIALTLCCGLAVFTGTSQARMSRDRTLAAALAYVDARCPDYGKVVNRSEWQHGWAFNALYGSCLGNYDQRIWFFVHGRFVGTDAKRPSHEILGMWRGARTIAFMYVLYRYQDPACCSTGGGKIVRYRWNSGRVVRLDRLPPVQDYSGSKPVGR